MKYWKDKIEHFYDEGKQKKRVLQWKRNLEKHVTENKNANIRLFKERIKIDKQLSSLRTILKQIYNTNDTIKKLKQIPRNDIKKYISKYKNCADIR